MHNIRYVADGSREIVGLQSYQLTTPKGVQEWLINMSYNQTVNHLLGNDKGVIKASENCF